VAGGVSFTIDVEDHWADPAGELRYEQLTWELLAWLERLGVRGTFFFVGQIAERHPDLVAAVGAAGHEPAVHGWTHTPLPELTPGQFRDDARRAKAVVEDLSGVAVRGFRAPTYSLVRKSVWATEVLAEEGYSYSSGVSSRRNPLWWYPGVPSHPFRWPSGLLETSGEFARVGRYVYYFGGGTFFRVTPWWMVRDGFARWADTGVAFLYCHPYDFDAGEERFRIPDVPAVLSPLLFAARRTMWSRAEALLRNPAPPLGERLSELGQLAATGGADPVSLGADGEVLGPRPWEGRGALRVAPPGWRGPLRSEWLGPRVPTADARTGRPAMPVHVGD
jgi:polysaccharide deacetylase family protein (PEP-CTERM system associated)